MGKGDKKTRRGKLWQGSYGVRRPKNKTATAQIIAPKAVNSVKPEKKAEKKPLKEKVEIVPQAENIIQTTESTEIKVQAETKEKKAATPKAAVKKEKETGTKKTVTKTKKAE